MTVTSSPNRRRSPERSPPEMTELTRALDDLLPKIRSLIASARSAAARSVNTLQVLTNFEIGRLIVEHQQEGAERAEYGKALLKKLAASLTEEFGRGFSRSNLEYMRRFFLTYQDRRPAISQTPSGILAAAQRSQKPSGKSEDALMSQTPSASFTLSWSHYVFLISVENPDERSFYEIEAATGGWTLAELKRQFNSGLYERLALSRDRDAIRDLAREGQIVTQPKDVLKNPYVLEFLGLEERPRYSESDLESAIIDKLEHFLLELGKGFLFEARQKRFSFDDEHFFVDLVFYNRLLRCYVLIDLKIGKLSHQDLGQMQMYVNYFDRHVKTAAERPTVGIILCKKKHEALVEITLPEDSSIYAPEYQLYLPSKEQLRRKLIDWAQEETE
jgi:predicted nuclease of restriction endonuclease-like (RecB) superfamily